MDAGKRGAESLLACKVLEQIGVTSGKEGTNCLADLVAGVAEIGPPSEIQDGLLRRSDECSAEVGGDRLDREPGNLAFDETHIRGAVEQVDAIALDPRRPKSAAAIPAAAPSRVGSHTEPTNSRGTTT
jgi:hypothetical protein